MNARSMRRLLAAAVSLCAVQPALAMTPDSEPLDSTHQRVLPCMACHGAQGRATNDGSYPRIAGQPAGYLYNQLLNFRDGRRQYPMMTYMVQRQSDAYLTQLADYFAARHTPSPPPQNTNTTPHILKRRLT